MALAAQARPRTLRLGTGTAITGTAHRAGAGWRPRRRINRIAPGRIHLGIATGNTAMRTMGQRPMRIAEYRAYLETLSALLRGETVDYAYNGETRPVRLLMHDETGYMNLKPKIPLYVSGFGRALWAWLASMATALCSPFRRAALRCQRQWRMSAKEQPARAVILAVIS